ncbi:hypothetical protein C0989_003211 [Termitomyces sp. Mn162]|nr:hypothetical protein C0989_003211 [Termitomyces sp. Mn162]
MSSTDTAAPFIHTISICGADWKHDKFSHSSPATNFAKWVEALKIYLSLLGLKSYVLAPLTSAPSTSSEPVMYCNWVVNNDLAHAIILMALDELEYEGLDKSKTVVNLYAQVKACAEGKGLVKMVALMQEILKIQCSLSEHLTAMAKQIVILSIVFLT